MSKDWVEWHKPYEVEDSFLSRRLAIVKEKLREAIQAGHSPLSIISICAGQGHDVIDVLAEQSYRTDIKAHLVELNEKNVIEARQRADNAKLASIDIVQGDAAALKAYEGIAPAGIVLACGIFGNISDQDICVLRNGPPLQRH